MSGFKVVGRRVDLSDGRIVFLGFDDNYPDKRFVAFRNAAGEDRKFIFTIEAIEALVGLCSDPKMGLPLADFPHKSEWRVYEPDAKAREPDA